MTELADSSLARAVVARYLKLALKSPHASSHQELNSARAAAALHEAALVLGIESGGVTERKPPLSELVTGYVRLFGHSLRGRVCPYEIEYGKRDAILQAQELSDVSGFYRAFGLEPSAKITERWDHVAVELEFVELLSTKEAYALETHQDEMFEVTRHALKRFLREHVGFFGIALGATLAVVAVVTGQLLLLVIIGLVFVAETVSVILQIGSYRLRGKRIFRMAPLHHHFELLGWAEEKITLRFWIVAALAALLGFSLFLATTGLS